MLSLLTTMHEVLRFEKATHHVSNNQLGGHKRVQQAKRAEGKAAMCSTQGVFGHPVAPAIQGRIDCTHMMS